MKIDKKGLRVVGYCRVSTPNQMDNTSIGEQKRRIEAHCVSQNFEFLRHYIDDGVTGTFYERPQFQKMLDAARNGEFDVLMVLTLDRLGRNLRHFLETFSMLRDENIHLVLVAQLIDTTSDTGDFQIKLLMLLAEFESKQIAGRTKSGKRAAARNGTFVPGKPPYGYIYNRENKNTIIVVDEEKSKVYHKIVDLYLTDHLSTTKVAEELTARAIPRPSGDVATWQADMVGRILRNPAYAGEAEFFTKSYETAVNPDGNPYFKRTNKPSGESITINFPPLITKSKWNAIQRQIELNKKKPRVNHRKHAVNTFLLGDLLGRQFVCGLCGAKMGSKVIKHYRSGNKDYKYMCSHHYQSAKLLEKRGHKKCPLPAIETRKADKEAWIQIASMLAEPKKFFKTWARTNQALRDSKSSRLKALTKKLENSQRQLDRMTDLVAGEEDQNIRQSYQDKQLTLSSEITNTKAEIDAVKREKHTTEDSIRYLQTLVEDMESQIPKMEKGQEGFLQSVYDALEAITDYQTRREIIAAVVAPENGGSVELNWDDKDGFDIEINAKVNAERIAGLFERLQQEGIFKLNTRRLKPMP